jgi:YVTN family beta-propeller protein
MKKFLFLWLLAAIPLAAQEIARPTELPGNPFFVKKTWIIGGAGPWDYLTMDPDAHQLFIAHGQQVQVVDVDTGSVVGEIPGFAEARSIALDNSGEFGYVSDGLASQLKVIDRRTFKVVASVPTGSSPRAVVYEPRTGLVFVVGGAPLPQSPGAGGQRSTQSFINPEIKSTITVIDAQEWTVLATILMPGSLGFAQTGGTGQVYISIVDRNQIARIDAPVFAARLQADAADAEAAQTGQDAAQSGGAAQGGRGVMLDWSGRPGAIQNPGGRISFFSLGPECQGPRALAVDSSHLRLFVACDDMKMAVLKADSGDLVASLPTGPGTDAIAYDPDRGLIYAANGGANGTLTIVHQDVTDTYSVIQNLPTRQRARTLAVDPATGAVYLVTDYRGIDLTTPGGIGTLKTTPVSGSFQVLMVGH